MCGIAGCVAAPGTTPDAGALRRMADAMRHRGPDDSGIEIRGSVGLVHRRLSIVDPSPAGHQPMRGPAGRLWVTYNGEVFNHAELREQLQPANWAGSSDTETLLHAHETWGDAAVGRLNGLFAYALLDEPRRQVVLVRDRFGVKPLYIARHGYAVWFASEVRALLAVGVAAEANLPVLQQFLQIGWAGGRTTPFAHVERVLPGSLVRIDLDSLSVSSERWFGPDRCVDPEHAAALARLSRREAVDAVEDALRTSVRRRLMSDVPLGTMCSGGIDSSLITALAAQESAQPLTAFNASLADRPEEDEGPWARRVADHLGIELRTAAIDADVWRATLVDAVAHCEYPLTHESTGPMGEIARTARAEGVKVLLSGEGADELFGGYPWRRPELHARFLQTGPRRLLSTLRRGRPDLAALLAAPRGQAAGATEWDEAAERDALAAYRHHPGVRGVAEAGLLAELSQYLPHLLNRQDKSTMQHSIETREPFLDPDLVELAVNLPLEQRLRPERKALLREVALRHVPREVVERPKVGFGFDVREYIVPRARPEFLHEGRIGELFGIDGAGMAAIAAGAQSHGTLLLWTGEIWCRLFLAGESPDTVAEALWAG